MLPQDERDPMESREIHLKRQQEVLSIKITLLTDFAELNDDAACEVGGRGLIHISNT